MRDYDNDDRTIGRVLADKAARCGDRPFLRFAGRVISYAQLDEMTSCAGTRPCSRRPPSRSRPSWARTT